MEQGRAIGIFDSGVGGLSVTAHIHRRLPAEHLLYVADSAFMPYGCRPSRDVEERCLRLAGFFVDQGVKALVVACNTATSMAIHSLRQQLDMPVIGMEPAIKPAVSESRRGVVGVLATTGTINSSKFNQLISRFAGQAKLIVQPSPGLVECVERGELQADRTRELLEGYLQPLIDAGMDRLVLGCTHYPFLIPLIRQLVGEDVAIVDTGEAIARELDRQLEMRRIKAADGPGSVQFWSTGDVATVAPLMAALWGEKISVNTLSL